MKWIKPIRDFGDVCPMYAGTFKYYSSTMGQADILIKITALGTYEIKLNGRRISDYVLAPGWTEKRLQVQEYKIPFAEFYERLHDADEYECRVNIFHVTVGRGWYRSPLAGWRDDSRQDPRLNMPPAIAVELSDSNGNCIPIDWKVTGSEVRFSELYDGEHFDARYIIYYKHMEDVEECEIPGFELVPQEVGCEILEQDRLYPSKIITTPMGDTVIDFGQNITGYIEFKVNNAKSGDGVEFSFAETLDKDGNFYTENYRSAKSKLRYTCNVGDENGEQSYKPKLTFFGFRYIRLDNFPKTAKPPKPEDFVAIVVHSKMERTGWVESSNPLLNRFFENVIWGQKGNFLDIPTDCPQRDERLGWTGDAQVFIKTAAYNFDVRNFFNKWLKDLALAQLPNGLVPHVVPDCQKGEGGSAAWADAAVIIPWELYMMYGDSAILNQQWNSMEKWQNYITNHTEDKEKYLWTGGKHFGDWLSLELPPPTVPDIRRGATRHDFLATAFYANTTNLLIKAGKVIDKNVSEYEELYPKIVQAFRERFMDYRTQTEYVLALHFDLVENPQEVANALAEKIASDGYCLKTGFVGTPYILHVLSRYNHTNLAYTLLLREDYPSWLYPVTKGATTIWERWDSIKPDGSFQTANMNSFNHYAYGAVVDWIYSVAGGITPLEPGFSKVQIKPHPDPRLGWLSVQIRNNLIISKWEYIGNQIRYDITTDVPAEIIIQGKTYDVNAGKYCFFHDV